MSDNENNVVSFEDRVKRLKQRRPDLANKDLSVSDNLDVDAFKALFPLPPPTSYPSLLQEMMAKEQAAVLKALGELSQEDRTRLLESGKSFTLFDGRIVLVD